MNFSKLCASTFLAVFTLQVFLPAPALANPPKGYVLKWSDEFNGNGMPDQRKWSYDTEANKTGWYNNELQYYAVNRKKNSYLASGALNITAWKEKLTTAPDYGGQAYTSARLISRDKFAFTYGFVEVRAKLPCKKGMWPAAWMLGTGAKWPDAGEIDFMEHVSITPGEIYGTLHSASTAGTDGDGGSIHSNSVCQAFHLYQVEWTKDFIAFALDGVVYHKVANKGLGAAQWPFTKPQYLLLNLAVGGDWPGPPEDASFPSTFSVDYIRVWQRAGN
jgi:beta-glucanase (GH16 family)